LLLACVAVYIVICEHLLPSLIVRRNPERVLTVLLPSFSVVARAMLPISGPLVRLLTSGKAERLAAAQEQAETEPGEVAHAYLEAGEEQGLIEGDEKRLLQSIVDFGGTLAREVMTPRPDIVAVSADATVADLRALFREQEYSRFPVYKDNLDNILGLVRVKDLLQIDAAELDRLAITRLVRPATFVPETKRVPELLKEFQRKQVQMAIVVDEYGGTAGLVTLEDLIEEIVGEIRDEDDVESEPIVEEGQGSYLFSAKVSFDDLRDRLHLEIESEGFETVGGYVLSRLGRVPAVGETFELDGLQVEVLEAERRRIHKVRFRKLLAVPNS
jgi:putative hemolysin